MQHDSLLRTRIRLKRKAQEQRLFIIIAFALLLGWCLWYSLIYTCTPEYALSQIKAAVEQHDTEKLHKYADVNLIASTAYDDLTSVLFDYDTTMSVQNKMKFRRFYTRIRPQLVTGMIELFDKHTANGDWPMPSGNDVLKGSQLAIDFEWFVECSLLRSTEIKEIKSTTHTDNTGIAEVEAVNIYTGTPFILNLALEKTTSGYWQVIGITNYQTYLTTTVPLITKDISICQVATQGIIDSYNNLFEYHQYCFKQITKGAQGSFNPSEKNEMAYLIQSHIIPSLMARQAALDKINVPSGAQYFVKLRQQSTKVSIEAWECFLRGVLNEDMAAFNKAESLHKKAMELDRRIEAIINHSTIKQEMPSIQ